MQFIQDVTYIQQEPTDPEVSIHGSINGVAFARGLLKIGLIPSPLMLQSCAMQAKVIGDKALYELISTSDAMSFELIAVTDQDEEISFNAICISYNTKLDKDGSLAFEFNFISNGLPKHQPQISIS